MKRIILVGLLAVSTITYAQETEKEKEKDNGTVSGGFESNAQWYLNDKGLLDEFYNPVVHPENPV